MKRSQRLEKVRQMAEDAEKRLAEAVAACERQLAESEARLAELRAYQDSYARDFRVRAGSGMDAVELRDYQLFLARLDEAIRQQSLIVARNRATRDVQRRDWQAAAQRAEAVGQIVRRWQAEEQRLLDRLEQIETDERAQRAWARQAQAHGA